MISNTNPIRSREDTQRAPTSNRIKNSEHGFGMIEIVVGTAVLATAMLGISSLFQATLKAGSTTQSVLQAGYLLEEGIEAVRVMRDSGYANSILKLSTTTPTYITWNGATSLWATTSVNTFIDSKYERRLTVADVNRDANDDIAVAGTYTPDTKLITMTVSWSERGATTSRSISTYLTNLFNN